MLCRAVFKTALHVLPIFQDMKMQWGRPLFSLFTVFKAQRAPASAL